MAAARRQNYIMEPYNDCIATRRNPSCDRMAATRSLEPCNDHFAAHRNPNCDCITARSEEPYTDHMAAARHRKPVMIA